MRIAWPKHGCTCGTRVPNGEVGKNPYEYFHLLRKPYSLGGLQQSFPVAALECTDHCRLSAQGRRERLSALLRDDGVHPCRADFDDRALGYGTGIKVVRGHYWRSSRIVCDNGGSGSVTGLKAASVSLVVCGMDASIPWASIC